ncbi:MAG TPA: hypothetical protein VF666_17345 [Pyrinomonadaceae bacterium]|jgi:hypothetical protein
MAAISSLPFVARRLRAILVGFALLACLLPIGETGAQNRTKKVTRNDLPCITDVNDGCIEISTTPGGYPVVIDGAPSGPTTEAKRQIALSPGPHTVEILFPNGNTWRQTFNVVSRRIHCINLNYNPRTVSIPPPPVVPCPYPVNVSAPTLVRDGSIITFTADVDYQGQSGLNYTWTVSPPSARIMSGANTPTITVDSTGLGGRRITAILVVDDGSGNRNCRQTAQAASLIEGFPPPPQAELPDEFLSVSNDADKARLDYLAIKLQENPSYRAYVIAYGGRTTCREQADILIRCALRYLVAQRGIEASRITTINGGLRDHESYQLWVLAPGTTPPTPTPTLSPSDARPRRTCARRCS